MTKPFGHFWETVHQASGEVTEAGFTREAMAVGEFPHDVCGYFLRVRALELTSTPPSGAAVKAGPLTQAHRKTALVLAQRAVEAVVNENFGYFPRNDKWADEVLSLRDALE